MVIKPHEKYDKVINEKIRHVLYIKNAHKIWDKSPKEYTNSATVTCEGKTMDFV